MLIGERGICAVGSARNTSISRKSATPIYNKNPTAQIPHT